MDTIINIVKLVIVIHVLMAATLLVGVWIGRRSCDHEDQ